MYHDVTNTTYIDSINHDFVKSWSNTAGMCISKDPLDFCFKQDSHEWPSFQIIGNKFNVSQLW